MRAAECQECGADTDNGADICASCQYTMDLELALQELINAFEHERERILQGYTKPTVSGQTVIDRANRLLSKGA